LFNTLTVFVVIMTLITMRLRFSLKMDSSLPILYYLILVVYARAYEGEYNNYMIFAGVVAALFLRFEFLGGLFLKLFRSAEFVVHLYILGNAFFILMVRT
ncbi:MAG: hypothetical protein ACRD96_16710, partial [Bryobacteraceae bacterium]